MFTHVLCSNNKTVKLLLSISYEIYINYKNIKMTNLNKFVFIAGMLYLFIVVKLLLVTILYQYSLNVQLIFSYRKKHFRY